MNPPQFYKQGKTYVRQLTPGMNVDIIGKASVIRFHMENKVEAREIISRLHFCCGGVGVHYVNVKVNLKRPPHCPQISLSNFDCTYLLTAVLSKKLHNVGTVQ